MTRPGIEPGSPGPLANTLTIMPTPGIHILAVYSYYLYERLHFSIFFLDE